jgi:hypothetical protein
MKRTSLMVVMIASSLVLANTAALAQVKWMAGGKMGLSLLDGNAGFQIAPMGEVLFGKGPAVGSELGINTQGGTPVEWANYFKYYFTVPGSKIKPYANGGFGLWFYTGGPYFSLNFGGGANFPVAKNLYVPAELQFGPVFGNGGSIFYFAITSGIRYEIL